MEEYYPDTIEVDSSTLSVITRMVRNSIGLRVPVFYTGSCEFESHRANTMKLIRSIMEVPWFSKPNSESSNLFESTVGNIVQRQNSWLLAIR